MENSKAGSNGRKYFLELYQGMSFRHGGIGNLDVEKILLMEGFQPIILPEQKVFLLYLKRWLAMRKFLRRIKSGDIIVCQFPVYPRMYHMIIRRLQKKGAKILAVLADIDGLKDQSPDLLEKELRLYRYFNHFIVHNTAMENWIRSVLGTVHIVQLGPFDFLANPYLGDRSMENGINFSGNLAKSGFLTALQFLSPLQFHIYGEGIQQGYQWPANVQYHGVSDPYELPGKIQGSFGLIWDGDSIYAAEGSLGHYMGYINHHKLSLYILAGMPVIAPAFAGSAEFILENGIGWVVNDLSEVQTLLEKITPADYQMARKKMAPIASDISKGNHLKTAIRKLLSS